VSRLVFLVLRGLFGLALACVALVGAQAQTFESVLAPGPLIKGHAKVEHDCDACHVRFDRAGQDAKCGKCHKDVKADIAENRGWHGRQPPGKACRNCHTDHRGVDAKVAEFDRKTFDHKQTDFELKHKHKDTECAKCHTAGKRWREASLECHVCHRADDKHHGNMGNKCGDCHTERKWDEVKYDHFKETKFALDGKHADVKCADCHPRERYKDTPKTCIGCHKKDDEHKGRYGEKCESCHDAKDWKRWTYNHDTETKYPLRGKHRNVKCSACHTAPGYATNAPTECNDCHKKDDKHKGTLGENCAACHTEKSWKDIPKFDHDKSRFPLLGKHAKVECKDCHKDQNYRETPSDCYACHKKDDKHEGNLGTKCADCHGEKDWKTTQGRFDHQRTEFALRNAHAAPKVKCTDCHKDLRSMRKTDKDCYACHKKDDKHEGTLGKQCGSCHTDRDWKVPTLDHNKTRFPLTGKHFVAKCKDCHVTARYNEAPRDCWSCHKKEDKHKEKYGRACEDCHNTRSWPLWDYDHDKRTKYPLTGEHRKVACDKCHTQAAPVGKKIAATSTDCYSCHRKDDVHDGRFGRRCDLCHATDNWKKVRRPGSGVPP
jgi:hypothetical protein